MIVVLFCVCLKIVTVSHKIPETAIDVMLRFRASRACIGG